MAIVGLIVQNHNGNVLFQNVREYLSHEKANIASKAFIDQITSYDDAFISRGTTSHLTGSIVVLNMYRIYYMILNEIYILAISQANDNPYEGALYLARAKRVLLAVSKELTEVQIQRKYSEVYFALERVLFGEDGVEVLTQRLSDVQPHSISNRIDGHQDELSPHQGSLTQSGGAVSGGGLASGGLVHGLIGSSNASTGGLTPGSGVSVGGPSASSTAYLLATASSRRAMHYPRPTKISTTHLPKSSGAAPVRPPATHRRRPVVSAPTASCLPCVTPPLTRRPIGGGQVAIDGSGSSSPSEQLPETTGRKYSISHVTTKRSTPVTNTNTPNSNSDDAASSTSPLVSSPKTSSFIDPMKPDTSANQSSPSGGGGSGGDDSNSAKDSSSTTTRRDHHSSVSIPIKSKIII
ncbi:hypothetical protein DFA_03662 [Cavenderia fasciculata]|uniref:Uncharacterized protein n=1 Tax=Cavenderia fasciculata TaxID=261658 RepID=F4PII4_CACFS|nr:uncharacterized protein DFA_03662 [Cavenderia fasciculata]EGG25413.1 hypothetical protein DFA_03662 [Cavenderia fasciculata]|eukprot:XP_004363264.1 hypothetical protein DFA_03662 [Cavenderia fasciculata]